MNVVTVGAEVTGPAEVVSAWDDVGEIEGVETGVLGATLDCDEVAGIWVDDCTSELVD